LQEAEAEVALRIGLFLTASWLFDLINQYPPLLMQAKLLLLSSLLILSP
jgi:hypothetical protein